MPLDGAEAASRMLNLAGMNNPMRGIPIIGGGGASLSAVPGSPGYADRINTGDPDEDILDLDPRADPTMLRAEAGARAFVPVDRGTLVGPARPEYRILLTNSRDRGFVQVSLHSADMKKMYETAILEEEDATQLRPLLALLADVVDLAEVKRSLLDLDDVEEIPASAADGRTQVEAPSGSLGSSPAPDTDSRRAPIRTRPRTAKAGGAAGG